MALKKYLETREEFIKRINEKDDFYITHNEDRYVSHITSLPRSKEIMERGFKTGHELNISEKRKAVYFSDRDVNYGMYARNKQGEVNDGEDIGEVVVNIKGLKLLNMTYEKDGIYLNHKKYKDYNVRGEFENIPFEIDGTISYLEDGRIYEVALKKDIANRVIVRS